MTHRTLHCANGTLYLLMGLAVAACAAWAISAGRIAGAWQISATIAAATVAALWGAYYAILLRWEVSPTGIRSRIPRRFYPWQHLQNAHLQQSDHHGIATCRLHLTFAEGELELSSELISLSELESLRDELIAAGYLQHPAPHTQP